MSEAGLCCPQVGFAKFTHVKVHFVNDYVDHYRPGPIPIYDSTYKIKAKNAYKMFELIFPIRMTFINDCGCHGNMKGTLAYLVVSVCCASPWTR